MKAIKNKLMSKFLILFLILVINACQNRDKCSVFCNVNEHPIHNKELNFYQDANEKPVKINNTYFVKFHLESKKYDTLSGYWGRVSDTIYYIKSLDYDLIYKYPMLIISDSIEQVTRIHKEVHPYYIKLVKLEIFNNDTIFTIEHKTNRPWGMFDLKEDVLSKINRDTLESKDFIEIRIYKLSLRNGILDYKVEKGIVRKSSLPYKYY